MVEEADWVDFCWSFELAVDVEGWSQEERQLHNVPLDASQAIGSVEEMNFRTVLVLGAFQGLVPSLEVSLIWTLSGSRRKKLGILEVPYTLEEMQEVVWSREETNRQTRIVLDKQKLIRLDGDVLSL
ncbi:hypothetical protein V6N13_147686 [Hibiscus sabdariffa]